MASTIGRATQTVYGGLEQFPVRSHYGEIEYCIANPSPMLSNLPMRAT